MRDNIFGNEPKKYELADYINFDGGVRGNLGKEIPVLVYRMMQYSLREQILEQYGKEAQVEVFRNAGHRAGKCLAENLLDLTLPFNEFMAQFQSTVADLKIGVMRVERVDEEKGRIILAMAEDADCSGLPLLGETVCNFDEGFISGVLSAYTKKEYWTIEIDCWATGDRVCRFCAQVKE